MAGRATWADLRKRWEGFKTRFWRPRSLPGFVLALVAAVGWLWKVADAWSVAEFVGDKAGNGVVSSVVTSAANTVEWTVTNGLFFPAILFVGIAWLAVIGLQPVQVANASISRAVQQRVPHRGSSETYQNLEIENVRWEDRGDTGSGDMWIVGPLCPKHLTPLTIPDYHTGKQRVAEGTDEIDPDSDYPSRHLVCLEDKDEKLEFSTKRQIADVRNEATTRFVGIRNRIRAQHEV